MVDTRSGEANLSPEVVAAPCDSRTKHKYKYCQYLPVYEEVRLPPLEPFFSRDRGSFADKEKRHLLSKENPSLKAIDLTPGIGTEIRGVQLSQLDDVQKDELALLVAERGVVIFRDQDFKDIGIEAQKAFGSYFGPLHIHPTGAHVQAHLELNTIYAGPDSCGALQNKSKYLNAVGFHSDVSFERQPPGVTILTMLAMPPTGGDTVWSSQTIAYERLSEPMQAFLETLRAEHSGFARGGGKFVRRAPIKTHHPIVRIHPVTGRKSLFISPGYVKEIVGLKEEESDAVMKLLFSHIAQGLDFQVRVKWEEGTVAIWDNRVTTHTPIPDYDFSNANGLRHGFRMAALAEEPAGVDGLKSAY